MGRPPLPIGERGNIKRTERPDGSFVASCRYRDTDGVTRRVKASGPSGMKAENALKRKLKDRTQGEDITSETRLSVACEHWHATLDGEDGTKERYRQSLDTHIIPKIGQLRLREATTARLDAFIRAVAVKGPTGGPSAARQARTVLSMVLGMCARYDAIPANPVRDTTRPASMKQEIRTMTPEEFRAFYQHTTGWLAIKGMGPNRNPAILDFIDLLIATGARPGEVLALQYEDVDLQAKTVQITGTVKRTKAQGLHRQEYTKTGSSPTLTLPAFAVAILRERYMASVDKRLVFTNRGGGLWEPANVRRIWREARGEAWAWVEPRSFRRIVATLIDREAGSDVAARQLGHSSDRITRAHYIAPDETAVDSSLILEAFRDRLRTGNGS